MYGLCFVCMWMRNDGNATSVPKQADTWMDECMNVCM